MTAPAFSAAAPAPAPAPSLPVWVWVKVFTRLLAIQGSWNYETLLGNGIGFCIEPALRYLPGGVHSPAFKEAMARESAYFNAHPYLASVAVGALAVPSCPGCRPSASSAFAPRSAVHWAVWAIGSSGPGGCRSRRWLRWPRSGSARGRCS